METFDLARSRAYNQWAKAGKVKGKWNEHYCLIAKKIEGKEKLDFMAFDLEDIELEMAKA